jgi:polyketide cyclase/dehydrase/lipid transport protein
MKAILAVVGALILAVAVFAFVQYQKVQKAASCPAKEIVTSSMQKVGDTWHVNFTSKIDAPLDKVFDAFRHPERMAEFVPENIRKSEVVDDAGNKKTLEIVGSLDILPPGFKIQSLRTQYTINPEEHRIVSSTVNKLAEITSDVKFEPSPDGKSTLLKVTQTSKQKQPLPTEALEKGVLCEAYATTVRAVNRALGLAPGPKAQAG